MCLRLRQPMNACGRDEVWCSIITTVWDSRGLLADDGVIPGPTQPRGNNCYDKDRMRSRQARDIFRLLTVTGPVAPDVVTVGKGVIS